MIPMMMLSQSLTRAWSLVLLIKAFLWTVWGEVRRERAVRFKEAWLPWSGSAESMLNFLYWYGVGRYLNFWIRWVNVYKVGDVVVKRWLRPLAKPARMTVILVPGLKGDEEAHYIEQFIVHVAQPYDLDVLVLCDTVLHEYANVHVLQEVIHRVQVDKAVKAFTAGDIGVVGFSGGSVVCVKYAAAISRDHNVKFVACVGGAFDILSIYHHMPQAWTGLFNWLLGHGNLGRDILQDLMSCKRLNITLEQYYRDSSCHQDVINARIPLYVCSALDDPLFPVEQLAAVTEASKVNPLVKTTFTQRGGHLGWKCGQWLHKTYFPKVFQEVLTEA